MVVCLVVFLCHIQYDTSFEGLLFIYFYSKASGHSCVTKRNSIKDLHHIFLKMMKTF
jgi:hypothetical protein